MTTSRIDCDDPIRSNYERTPYVDPAIPQFDVMRLLGTARLFGLGPDLEAADDLRVLDLACSSGAHIRDQAARYPNVRFTGVDFAQNEIEIGRTQFRFLLRD